MSIFDPFSGDKIELAITIPVDEDGFMGRECPAEACEGYFKVKPDTGQVDDDLPRICPYCGHSAPSDEFFTKEQVEYAKSIAFREFTKSVDRKLKKMEFSHEPKGLFGIGVSMKVKSGPLPPIRTYREKSLETRTVCSECSHEYSVFGLFAYCPDCSAHNSLQILHRNLNLTRKQVDLTESMEDPDLRTHILEDALENCVSAFDSFGREACRVRDGKCTKPGKALSVSFQNLGRASTRVRELFGLDIALLVSEDDWRFAEIAFMQRHVLAHRAGVIDQKYIDESNDSASLLGRKLKIEPNDVKRLTEILDRLGKEVILKLPNP